MSSINGPCGQPHRESSGLRRFIGLWLVLAGSAAGQSVPGEFIVELERGALASRKAGLRSALSLERVTVEHELGRVLDALIVRTEMDAAQLRWLPGVRAVHPVVEYQLHLDRAIVLHKADAAWEKLGGIEKAGQGIKVAIVDTGIEASHPGLSSEGLEMPAGFPKVNREGDAVFTSAKVIVARDYTGGSAADTRGHGTSVAMAAAGGQVESPQGWISGLAPRAWLGSYKVFPDGTGGATNAAILRALDDAVGDGMDVINLSLGSMVAPDPADDVLARAVERATESGVIVVISAGNSGPDPNTIASPGTAPSAITVGNSRSDRRFAAAVAVESGPVYAAVPGSRSNNADPVVGSLKSVHADDPSGMACGALPPSSLAGQVALILRGVCFFSVKLANAQAAGAVGAIVYTDEARPEADVTMDVGDVTLPATLVSYADGRALRSALENGPVNLTLRFTPGPVPQEAGRMSDSSSRGPSPVMTLKPEIAATGAPLFTAQIGGGWRSVSGTSLSAPLVTGAAAVLKGYRPGLTTAQYKSLLVNHAQTLAGPVQHTGAGALDVLAALQGTAAMEPAVISFGATSDGPGSRELRLVHTGTAQETYFLEGAEVEPATVTLEPGATARIMVRRPAAAESTVEGAVRVRAQSTGVVARVPYWLGVARTEAKYLTVLDSPQSASPSSRQTIWVRVTDESGIPVAGLRVSVTPVGEGIVESVLPAETSSPGSQMVTVRMGTQRGTQIFRLEAGGLQRDVSIPVQ